MLSGLYWGYNIGVLLGLYWGYNIGVILGLYWSDIIGVISICCKKFCLETRGSRF